MHITGLSPKSGQVETTICCVHRANDPMRGAAVGALESIDRHIQKDRFGDARKGVTLRPVWACGSPRRAR